MNKTLGGGSHPPGSSRPGLSSLRSWVTLPLLSTFIAVMCLGCRHAPPQVERRIHVISEDAPTIGGSGSRNCDEEQVGCFERCWNARERPYPHVHRDEWYYKYCTKKCREEYLDCLDAVEKATREAPKLSFTSMDSALSWLRAHKTQLIIGTVVVVAGVAFIITTGGSGALLLVPAAL